MLYITVLSILLWTVVCGCPREESIAPKCACKNFGDGPILVCSNVMNAEELIPPIMATNSMDMFAINIVDSSLMYVPSKIFKNTNYAKIRFANSQIMSLSDSDLAFEGLEDTLEEIRATDAHYITSWDWDHLRNMRRLELIDVHLISMYSLDHPFPPLKRLRFLSLGKAEISFIHEEAFQGLENLHMLLLKDNEISEMKRSMLPNPAVQLYTIDLSGNHLADLPKDMFSGMPNLVEVRLSNNRLITLDEDTFSWPFEKLQELLLNGNDFRCDCRMRWLVGIKTPHYFQGVCSLPENLKDVQIRHLTNKVLWC
ncbi:hypothetical protein JTE90_001119 [Oedothorax gibbosus]|uniref:Uncharacterized protein n=1 Tax=Oedothorax gibbosus TaxID=931172 RepID=A0AAV6VJU3_9ARAC|nr:hypothetical protein JTE90_001119 [Oedothorax gibbosus]